VPIVNIQLINVSYNYLQNKFQKGENFMTKNSELRRMAREQLGGNIFSANWLLMLVVFVISGAMGAIAGEITFFVLGLGSLVVMGAITYGNARATTNVARGQKANILDVFKGFTEGFGRTFKLGFMTSLFIFLWTLLFIVPGIVKSYSYAMAPYIMQDDPSKDWKQCLDESKEMMDGHKGQLFGLHLSFIGWMLLGMLCFGIGELFVTPYMNQATANFYLELKKQNA
jgi:uncharacterized membrane protein